MQNQQITYVFKTISYTYHSIVIIRSFKIDITSERTGTNAKRTLWIDTVMYVYINVIVFLNKYLYMY